MIDINTDEIVHICYNCDQEFSVRSAYEDQEPVIFCPFCSHPLEESEIYDEDDEEYEDDEDIEDWEE